jgi:hypothetical protein
MALVIGMVFAAAGSVWYGNGGAALQKGGSMTAFLDGIAKWFQSIGVHPVLGAFMAGVVIAFVFAYRRSPPVELTPGAPAPVARALLAESESVASQTANAKVTIDGRTVEIPPQVMAHIRNGHKIEAIKALRNASGLDLKAAKAAVDSIADSPAMRH